MKELSEIKGQANAYTKGMIVGGILGAGIGLVLKKRIVLLSVIGAIVGGYVAGEFYKSEKKGLSSGFSKIKDMVAKDDKSGRTQPIADNNEGGYKRRKKDEIGDDVNLDVNNL